MKPRNKFEKAVLAESKNLRQITKTQCKWAFRECINHFPTACPKVVPLIWIVGIVGHWKSLKTLAPALIAGQGCRLGKPLNAR